MPAALLILIGCQLIGELSRRALHLPLPGPVIGMFLLAVVLAVGSGTRMGGLADETSTLNRTANALIANMGLLFVPAGVGLIAEAGVLRRNWLPLSAGLLVSTVLGLIVTGLVMHRLSHTREATAPTPALAPSRQDNSA